MATHPDLIRAVVLASIAATPDRLRRQLAWKDAVKREQAEDLLADRIVVALAGAC